MAIIHRYVLGFAFSDNLVGSVLIRKARPVWQAGKYNGVGGKIENAESPRAAMAREFEEETSVKTDASVWKDFAQMIGSPNSAHPDKDQWIVYCFTTKLSFSELSAVKTNTDEQILVTSHFNQLDLVPCVNYLVPLARDFFREEKFTEIFYE